MTERILVCTNGQEGALGALRLANALAERDGRGVDVLAVIAPVFLEGVTLYSLPGDFVSGDGGWMDDYREAVRNQLSEVGGPVGRVEPHVEIGNVAHTIVTFAETHGHGMIVIGAGRHGRAERWTGSEISLYVSRLARVPVLTVPAEHEGLPEAAVVGVDFSEYSRDAAVTVARLLGPGGRLHLAHATWLSPGEQNVSEEWLETYESGAKTRLAELAGEVKALGIVQSVDAEVVTGDATDALLELARDTGAQLVAAGSHGHGFFSRMLLGSTSTRLLRRAKVPVLITPPRAASEELRQAAEEHAKRARARGASPEPLIAM